ncbi:MAG TPA: hypothetical protein PK151_04345 [Caldisericia bacterium]|nr:hypothetical protein [Caldisericia bacterium]
MSIYIAVTDWSKKYPFSTVVELLNPDILHEKSVTSEISEYCDSQNMIKTKNFMCLAMSDLSAVWTYLPEYCSKSKRWIIRLRDENVILEYLWTKKV